MMKNFRKKRIMAVVLVADCLLLAAVLLIYHSGNYSGGDVARYAGRWQLESQWSDGKQIGVGFGDELLLIKDDGEVCYKDSGAAYDTKIEIRDDRCCFFDDDGARYTLSLRRGNLVVDYLYEKDGARVESENIYIKKN